MVLKGESQHGVSIALGGGYPVRFGHSYRAQIDSQTVRVDQIDQNSGGPSRWAFGFGRRPIPRAPCNGRQFADRRGAADRDEAGAHFLPWRAGPLHGEHLAPHDRGKSRLSPVTDTVGEFRSAGQPRKPRRQRRRPRDVPQQLR